MAVKRILMLIGDCVEECQAMVPFQMLQMVGHTVHAVCPEKGQGDSVHTVIHERTGDQTYSEKPGRNLVLNATFEIIDPAKYDALVIPGGRAPEYLRLNLQVIEIVHHFAAGGKPIASIGHGQQILATAGVLDGKRCTAYPTVRPELECAGGIWCEINDTASNAYVDGNLVTAPACPAHPEWMRKFLELLGTRIEP